MRTPIQKKKIERLFRSSLSRLREDAIKKIEKITAPLRPDGPLPEVKGTRLSQVELFAYNIRVAVAFDAEHRLVASTLTATLSLSKNLRDYFTPEQITRIRYVQWLDFPHVKILSDQIHTVGVRDMGWKTNPRGNELEKLLEDFVLRTQRRRN